MKLLQEDSALHTPFILRNNETLPAGSVYSEGFKLNTLSTYFSLPPPRPKQNFNQFDIEQLFIHDRFIQFNLHKFVML